MSSITTACVIQVMKGRQESLDIDEIQSMSTSKYIKNTYRLQLTSLNNMIHQQGTLELANK